MLIFRILAISSISIATFGLYSSFSSNEKVADYANVVIRLERKLANISGELTAMSHEMAASRLALSTLANSQPAAATPQAPHWLDRNDTAPDDDLRNEARETANGVFDRRSVIEQFEARRQEEEQRELVDNTDIRSEFDSETVTVGQATYVGERLQNEVHNEAFRQELVGMDMDCRSTICSVRVQYGSERQKSELAAQLRNWLMIRAEECEVHIPSQSDDTLTDNIFLKCLDLPM